MIKKVKIAVCDDDEIIVEIIEKKIINILGHLKMYNFELKTYTNVLEYLECEEKSQILILDIEMPEMNGIDVAIKLNKLAHSPCIIFLSGHEEYMKYGYHVNAFRYLTKPINDRDLSEAINSAISKVENSKSIIFKMNDIKYIVQIEDIMYIKVIGEYCKIYTENHEFVQINSLKNWKLDLPAERFVQTHRSYVVNLAFIKNISGNSVQLKNGESLPVSTRNKKKINDCLYKFIQYMDD